MLNKTRVFTAIGMVIVLVPFIFLGGYFIYGLCAVLAFIGTYELVKMHNRKYNLPKFLDFVVSYLLKIPIWIPLNLYITALNCHYSSENEHLVDYYRLHSAVFGLKTVMTVLAEKSLDGCFIFNKGNYYLSVFGIAGLFRDDHIAVENTNLYHLPAPAVLHR